MTELKIRTIGTGLGIELPHDVLDQLKLHKGESLSLEIMPDGNYRLANYNEVADEQLNQIEDYMHEEDA